MGSAERFSEQNVQAVKAISGGFYFLSLGGQALVPKDRPPSTPAAAAVYWGPAASAEGFALFSGFVVFSSVLCLVAAVIDRVALHRGRLMEIINCQFESVAGHKSRIRPALPEPPMPDACLAWPGGLW